MGILDKIKDCSHVINSFVAQNIVHYEATGPEIWNGSKGKVDAFVGGIRMGGTMTGVGKFLKICGTEPRDHKIQGLDAEGDHKIQGIGACIVPVVLDVNILNEVIMVSNAEAIETAKLLALKEGLLIWLYYINTVTNPFPLLA
ncbi:cysteine synthase [Helianthus annuus]|uniref:cysteine synthase n=1 Tax=Helianthus annuus TaxID=4232 RepID=UPI000B909787|nr:cysteine synthase [Helianthus annuus]